MPQADKKAPLWYWPTNVAIGIVVAHFWRARMLSQDRAADVAYYSALMLVCGVVLAVFAAKFKGPNFGPIAAGAFAMGATLLIW